MKSYLYTLFFFKKSGEKKNQKIFFKRKKSLKGAAWKWPPQVPLERTVIESVSQCLPRGVVWGLA